MPVKVRRYSRRRSQVRVASLSSHRFPGAMYHRYKGRSVKCDSVVLEPGGRFYLHFDRDSNIIALTMPVAGKVAMFERVS